MDRRARAELLLDTAAELLMRHGYKRVTIEDVARRAGVGKGTVYLHWKTREALFFAALERETVRLLEGLLAGLAADPRLALPHRLMREVFLGVSARPLVRALLLADPEMMGNLARDESVQAAQRDLADNPDYLRMLEETGLLRPGLTPETAGVVLGNVLRGFFTDDSALPVEERADLLADVLARTLEPDTPPPAQAVTVLRDRLSDLFTAMAAVQRGHLLAAY